MIDASDTVKRLKLRLDPTRMGSLMPDVESGAEVAPRPPGVGSFSYRENAAFGGQRTVMGLD